MVIGRDARSLRPRRPLSIRQARVHRVVCVIDCGLVVNPLGIESQVEGGVIWGLSSALKGAITFRDGRVEQSTCRDFPVLRGQR